MRKHHKLHRKTRMHFSSISSRGGAIIYSP
ncbi:hypothetical protein RF007C_11065 [Ruminococcus flavefaciens 007c]|uniref:Uncharacterized protein n=1 Tax=Ruminococcus flavefaciens 007c TaxID=1341157 RepID=W7UI23_RUMFL|nr:hypothetical protein RF007C_11065 [Ruminococcus flavefaciens 007c]